MIQQLIFYAFAGLLIGSGCLVVFSRNPVRAALFLVLSFVFAAPLWLMLEAEFLALVLIFVYVGAVMTLFLFVVMMLNLDEAPKREGFVRYLPFALLLSAMIIGIMYYILGPSHFAAFHPAHWMNHDASYSNTQAIGEVLYTQHVFAFELAAVILLVAIVAAISLAFRGARGRKGQCVDEQVKVRRQDRVRLVKMPAEKNS